MHQDLRYKLRGYDEVSAEEGILQTFLDRLYALSLPIRPDLSGCGGLDGTHFEVALEGDLSSGIRFQWWEEGQDQWLELTTLVSETIKAFLPLPLREAQPSDPQPPHP